MGLCSSNSCKITSCQIWRFEKKYAIQLESNHTRADQVRVPDDGIILKVLQLVKLQPFDLERPEVPLWKNLNYLQNILLIQRTESISRICFAFSQWPHLHRAFFTKGTIFSFWNCMKHSHLSRPFGFSYATWFTARTPFSPGTESTIYFSVWKWNEIIRYSRTWKSVCIK